LFAPALAIQHAPSQRRFPFRLRPVEAGRVLPLPQPGHSLLIQPDEGVAPILSALQGARQRLVCKMFNFNQPELVEAVVAAHQRGVEVRIMLNPARSDGTRANDETFERFALAGVPVRWTNPRYTVSHEKTLIVDDRAFVCTFNFAPKYFTKTRGFALVTTRTAEIAEVLECFEADWNRTPFVPRDLLVSGDGNSRRKLVEFLASAQRSIDIQHPKIWDFAVLDRLVEALARGVRVRFLCSAEKSVNPEDAIANAASMRIMVHMGAEILRIKKPRVHAKLIIVDGVKAQLGSMNLTPHCFDLRRELGLFVEHPAVVRQLRQVYELDWSRAQAWAPPDPLQFA